MTPQQFIAKWQDVTGLAEPKNLDVLRKVFTDPDALKPGCGRRCQVPAQGRGLRGAGGRTRLVPRHSTELGLQNRFQVRIVGGFRFNDPKTKL